METKMNFRKLYNRKVVWFLIIIFLIFLAFCIYWIGYLQIAHSTFENYYAFRGCVQLIEKTDTYGMCKLSSGQTIKLVKFKNKWYLDGDLSYPGFNFL